VDPYASAATVQQGFVDEPVVGGLTSPTSMAFAPDGRLFVCEQGGKLRVVKNGVLLSTPFLTLTVNASGERGLLGVAFDPNFATNKYVYVYYTATTPAIHNRVARYVANGDVASTATPVTLLDLDNLSTATNHNGGSLHFGADGKLYIGVGENANSANAQSMTTVLGKLLRINNDGTIPTDNPFYASTTGKYRSIWALGLRNPFSFDVQPGTGKIFINDVGQNTWEEIDRGIAGANYGWPTTEGATTDPRYVTPIFTYLNDASTCAIAGGAFYNPATQQYPSGYNGHYFFADYCGNWIQKLDPSSNTITPFATGISAPVDVDVGPDGSVYYLAHSAGTVGRIRYAGGQPASVVQQPVSVTRGLGQTATFSVGVSGSQPITFQWRRDGVDIAGATADTFTTTALAASDDGAVFTVFVSNSDGGAVSNPATLTVLNNYPPQPTITAPVAGSFFDDGDTISYAGSATDTEDGAPPAAAYSWKVDFHHDTHVHPFLADTAGATSGSLVIPRDGEVSTNVWYRIYLTVTDSTGLSTTVHEDIHPNVVTLGVQTNPTGLQVTIDGIPVTTPASFPSVVGAIRRLGAPAQTVGSTSYVFTSWSDGLGYAHDIVAPAAATTYTATYQGTATPWISKDIGAVAAAGTWSESSGVHTILASGADIWGTADEFRYTYQQVTGNATITARVTELQHTQDFAKAGVMFRQTLNADSVNVHALVSSIASSGFRYTRRPTTGASSVSEVGASSPLPGAPGWVRVVRAADVFTAYSSLDGVTFTQLGTPQTIAMGSTVYVGMAVTSHLDGTLAQAKFDNVSITMPLPTAPPAPTGLIAAAGDTQVSLSWSAAGGASSYTVKRSPTSGGPYTVVQAGIATASYLDTGLTNGTTYYYVVSATNTVGEGPNSAQASATPVAAVTWSSQDVGTVGAAGSWSQSNGTFTVKGAGADIYGTADGFRFVYRNISGNATITARVVSIQNINTWSKAGVMMRSGTAAGAANVFMLTSPTASNGYRRQARTATSGTTSSTTGGGGTNPVWLRIVRNGNTFTSYYSGNGTSWTAVGSATTISMPSTISIGLAVSSHVSATLATGTFDGVTVTTP
jgi:glucose/arabinose dehydrogenase